MRMPRPAATTTAATPAPALAGLVAGVPVAGMGDELVMSWGRRGG
jgi:hypothetical protein